MLALSNFCLVRFTTNCIVILVEKSSIMLRQLKEATADLIKEEAISLCDVHFSFISLFTFFAFVYCVEFYFPPNCIQPHCCLGHCADYG